MNGVKNPILIPKSEHPLDYKEFTNPPTQEQNVREELARVEDLLSSEEVSIPEPDSAAAPSSQSAFQIAFTEKPPHPATKSKPRQMSVWRRRWFQCRGIFAQPAVQTQRK